MFQRQALGRGVVATVLSIATLGICIGCTSTPIDPDDPFLSSTTSSIE